MTYLSFNLLDSCRPILVFGCDGQVGRALQVCLKNIRGQTVFLSRSDCDLTKESCIVEVLHQYQPQIIINAAAYTSVDKAEIEQNMAFAINARAPELMAHYIANVEHGILIHYSTDYVFADTKQAAYSETDSAGPVELLNVYGQSKLAGERSIIEVFNLVGNYERADCVDKFCRYFILRTSWVYGDGVNFISKILRLAADRDQLEMVVDQVGAPTSAQWLAEISIQIARSQLESGIYHAVPDGKTSRYDLARFAIEAANNCGGSIKVKSENISPISTTDYPVLAKRYFNSCLDNKKLKKSLSEMACTELYPSWQKQVETYIKALMSNI